MRSNQRHGPCTLLMSQQLLAASPSITIHQMAPTCCTIRSCLFPLWQHHSDTHWLQARYCVVTQVKVFVRQGKTVWRQFSCQLSVRENRFHSRTDSFCWIFKIDYLQSIVSSLMSCGPQSRTGKTPKSQYFA